MYRDASASLDERDRAVGAILISEALIASCERAHTLGQAAAPEAWRAIRDAHDDFPEIWRSLDRARHELARRGANVTGYDELRPHMRTRLATATDDTIEAVRVDPAALDDARRAADELKLAVAGTDWAAIERRTSGLVHAPLTRRRRNRLVLGGLAVAITAVLVAWLTALVPTQPAGRQRALYREVARHVQLAEFAQITAHRRVKIAELQRAIGDRCDPRVAHELTRQLMMDGRGAAARAFAADYTARCGEDQVVLHWANAPLP